MQFSGQLRPLTCYFASLLFPTFKIVIYFYFYHFKHFQVYHLVALSCIIQSLPLPSSKIFITSNGNPILIKQSPPFSFPFFGPLCRPSWPDTGDPLASTSRVAGIIGMCHHAQRSFPSLNWPSQSELPCQGGTVTGEPVTGEPEWCGHCGHHFACGYGWDTVVLLRQ